MQGSRQLTLGAKWTKCQLAKKLHMVLINLHLVLAILFGLQRVLTVWIYTWWYGSGTSLHMVVVSFINVTLGARTKCVRLRSCLFCEGRISVLKRWFKTPIQNALHGSTVHASLEKKTISWACTAHCSRLLFELKWTGKAFIWRHLNVVICDFAFMLPPESAFCSNHDRKRTFLGCIHAYFAKAESAFWNADSKRRSKTPFTGVLFMLPSRRRRFREHALRIVRGYCSSSSEPERRLYDVI